MSVSTPTALSDEAIYGVGIGRGDLERQIIETLVEWVVPYVASYERQNGIPARQTPVPPTPESIHGGVDYVTFSAELFPELIVVCQPWGVPERYDDGTYGSWFSVGVGAIVQVEGSQDQTRALADLYGEVLQKLIPQQGAFGLQADGETFATRTRLESAYSLAFPDATVRDILRATVEARTYLTGLVSDFEGPRVPPADPYAVPLPPTIANRVEVGVIRGTPDTSGETDTDAVILDGTVYPPVVRYEEITVDEPSDETPDPSI